MVALLGDTLSGAASPVTDDTTRLALPLLLTVSVVDALLGWVAFKPSGPAVELNAGAFPEVTSQLRLYKALGAATSLVGSDTVSLNDPTAAREQLTVNTWLAEGAIDADVGVTVIVPPGEPSESVPISSV